MSRTQKPQDSCPLPAEHFKRAAFVIALQRRYPDFWIGLNEVWRDGKGLLEWMRDEDVVDEWLAEYVFATIKLWDSHPSGPGASLRPGFLWFGIPPDVAMGMKKPDFKPHFDTPHHIDRRPDDLQRRLSELSLDEIKAQSDEFEVNKLEETDDDFHKRMRAQFEAEMTKYKKSVSSSYGLKVSAETLKHADWTVMAFAGLPYAEIARQLPTSPQYRAPEDTVRKAVKRFAGDIGLTLPTRTKKPGAF
jgi:hypothetical protein